MTLRSHVTAVTLLAISGAALTGCSSDDSGVAAPEAPSTATSLSLGQVHDAGEMQVSVSPPRAVTTSPRAKPQPNAPAFGVDVTLTNTGPEAFPVVGLFVKAQVAGAPAAEVYDDENGFSGGVTANDVPPGGRATVSYGFSGGQAGPLTVSVDGVADVPVTFTGTL